MWGCCQADSHTSLLGKTFCKTQASSHRLEVPCVPSSRQSWASFRLSRYRADAWRILPSHWDLSQSCSAITSTRQNIFYILFLPPPPPQQCYNLWLPACCSSVLTTNYRGCAVVLVTTRYAVCVVCVAFCHLLRWRTVCLCPGQMHEEQHGSPAASVRVL